MMVKNYGKHIHILYKDNGTENANIKGMVNV